MILDRIKSFLDWFDIPLDRQHELKQQAIEAAFLSQGMTHLNDYLALAAILEHAQPQKVFEIGTYKGLTTNFILDVLPEAQVVSIGYINPKKGFFQKKFNNSELSKEDIGCHVHSKHQHRFVQLIGDSHEINPIHFVKEHGLFDFVFIDGDHSVKGVEKDTHLALNILSETGSIAWHDANPKCQYEPVRHYLEKTAPKPMIATYDDYVGGVACWNPYIEHKLTTTYAQI